MVLCRWHESLRWRYKTQVSLDRLTVSEIWPIKVETNFTQNEIKSLKKKRFVLNRWQSIFLRSLFGGKSSILINRPMNEMSWPTSCNGKVVCHRMPFKMINLHYSLWGIGQFLEVIVNPPLEVPLPRYGWIYKILFSQNPNKKQYEITIRNFPACTCLDFVAMISNSSGWPKKWVPCKHMYCVLQHVMFCGQFKSFIHFLTSNCDEVRRLLNRDVILV